MRPVRLKIRNDLSELRRMTAWLRAEAEAGRLSSAQVEVLDVCANEAVCNIISYAFPRAGDHDIELELTPLEGGDVRLTIRDDGQPFNPLEAPQPAHPASLAEAPIGGLGITLIRRLASRCDYRREHGHNLLSLEASAAREHA